MLQPIKTFLQHYLCGLLLSKLRKNWSEDKEHWKSYHSPQDGTGLLIPWNGVCGLSSEGTEASKPPVILSPLTGLMRPMCLNCGNVATTGLCVCYCCCVTLAHWGLSYSGPAQTWVADLDSHTDPASEALEPSLLQCVCADALPLSLWITGGFFSIFLSWNDFP